MAGLQESPQFLEYVALLRQLRGLISEGKGESEDADRLRDRMDEPWLQLTAEDIARIDTLAGAGDVGVPLTRRETEGEANHNYLGHVNLGRRKGVGMAERLIFTQSPAIVIASNTFICRIPIRYRDTPMLEFVKELTTLNTDTFTTKIPIFHSDGTKLAVVKGANIYPTKEGEKSGVTMRHPPDVTVCELNGRPVFEIRRRGAAAISMTAELHTFDGAFLKWSEVSLSGLLTTGAGNSLQIGGLTLKGNTFQGEVGIQIGRPAQSVGGAVYVDFAPAPPPDHRPVTRP